jgi:hypothetical protein
MSGERDYKAIYKEFWKELVEKNGKLNKDAIMRELADYEALINNVTEVYCYVTDGRLSKTNTDPLYIKGYHDEACEDAYNKGVEDTKLEYGIK